MNSEGKEHLVYDVAIIGAGPSGLAAALRLSISGLSCIVLESHAVVGGLNSFYKRKVRALGKTLCFDVGLHALTNIPRPGRRSALTKVLRQLRIPIATLSLKEQSYSEIVVGNNQLKFSNRDETLDKEIQKKFPEQYLLWMHLKKELSSYSLGAIPKHSESAREYLVEKLKSPELAELLITPLLLYGSSWEDDMSFDQFVVMAHSLYLEGMGRPANGIEPFWKTLLGELKSHGAQVKLRTAVEHVQRTGDGRYQIVCSRGKPIVAKKILSSAGMLRTEDLLRSRIDGLPKESSEEVPVRPSGGKITLCESLFLFPKEQLKNISFPQIRFWAAHQKLSYRCPEDFVNLDNAVFCFPDSDNDDSHFLVRCSFLANGTKWIESKNGVNDRALSYEETKQMVQKKTLNVLRDQFPELKMIHPLWDDLFTPATIQKYTGHTDGAIYGGPLKKRELVPNVFLIGADEGGVGLVGAMMSGVAVANEVYQREVLN